MEEEEQQPSTDAEDAEYTTEDTDNDADTISNADKSTSAMDGKDWANKTKTKKKKRKRKGKKKGVKKEDEEEKKYPCDPAVYSPCPHLHFKADVIEREVLTREQHLMLLSTPRGYRWEPERSPRYCTSKKRRRKVGGSGDANVKNAGKTDRRIRPAEKHIEKCDEKYVGRFLGEIWNYLPPDMVDNLKKLLVEEFGMTEKEAEDFIKNQGEQGASTLEKDPQQKPELVPSVRTGARYKWVKDFSKIFANKMADYIIMLLSAKRTPRVRKLAEAILKHFADITGEKVTLRKADTRLQKIMVFIADRIAIWLDSIMKEAQTADTADKAVEVKLQTDGGEDGDKRQPKKKKKKKEEGEEEEEQVEEEKVEEEEEKEFKSAKSSQKSSKTASKEPSKEPSKESSKEASKTASKASSKASTKSKESSKEKVEEEQKAEEEEEEKGAAEEEEEKVKEEEEAGAGDAVEEEAKGEEGGEEEAVEEEQEAQEEAQGEAQEEVQEEAQEEEPQQDEQAEDIKQVLEDQLTDPETAEKLSAIISNILKETDDLVKPPLPPLIPPGALRKKSFVYQIARQDGSVYNIRQLSSQTVAEKVAEARSREKPPRKAPGLFERPNSLSPMNLKNMADWSRWAIEVADIAEDWTKWINQTVATAELASNAEKERLRVREENEGGGRTSKEERPFTKQNWKDWQARIQEQADDFRKIKKELKRSGSEWSKKAELGGAGGGGAEEGGADGVGGEGGGVGGGEDEEKETGVITYDEGKQEEEEGKTEEKAEEETKEGEEGEVVVEKTEEE